MSGDEIGDQGVLIDEVIVKRNDKLIREFLKCPVVFFMRLKVLFNPPDLNISSEYIKELLWQIGFTVGEVPRI